MRTVRSDVRERARARDQSIHPSSVVLVLVPTFAIAQTATVVDLQIGRLVIHS